jgi:hypothetical protein
VRILDPLQPLAWEHVIYYLVIGPRESQIFWNENAWKVPSSKTQTGFTIVNWNWFITLFTWNFKPTCQIKWVYTKADRSCSFLFIFFKAFP